MASVTQEMAEEIVRIAQTRIVEVDRVRFTCGVSTLQMVRNTLGYTWLLNDNVLYNTAEEAAEAFHMNILADRGLRYDDKCHYYIRFGPTDTVVWCGHKSVLANCSSITFTKATERIVHLLKDPPVLI